MTNAINFHSLNDRKILILDKGKNYHRGREEYWIRRLGTAISYGCNDNIKSKGNLSSQYKHSMKVTTLLHKNQSKKRSHGHRHYTSPKMHDVSL